MTIKVFKANSQGKIELTQAELEKLLNEAYDSGYKEGRQSVSINIPSTQPYWAWRDGITTTGTLGNGNIALLSDKTTASDAITGTTATTKTNLDTAIKTTAKAVTDSDSGIINSKELGEAVNSILRNFVATRSCPAAGTAINVAKSTPFVNLQKELAGL